MNNQGFDKETFKKSVIDNTKNLFRKTIDEATPAQVFQALRNFAQRLVVQGTVGLLAVPRDKRDGVSLINQLYGRLHLSFADLELPGQRLYNIHICFSLKRLRSLPFLLYSVCSVHLFIIKDPLSSCN